MFTNNYYSYINSINPLGLSNIYPLTSPQGVSRTLFVRGSANYSKDGLNISSLGLNSSSSIPQSGCVCFGTGTTPENVNDYTVEAMITSGITLSTALSQEVSNNQLITRAAYTVTNTSSSDKNISEMGIFTRMYYNNGSDSAGFLIYRKVFSEPITITPGNSKVITLSFKHEV